MRIVSLLPSATEIICAVGLADYLVGVSHECDYPDRVKKLPSVTTSLIPKEASSIEIDLAVRKQLDTKKAIYHLDLPKLQELKPDFIITQSLCEVCAVAEDEVQDAVCQLPGNTRVINLEPMTLSDVYDTLILVGEETGFIDQAKSCLEKLKGRVEAIIDISQNSISTSQRSRIVFLEWIDPPFNAGHWTPELIEYAGGISLLSNKHKPSTTLAWENILKSNPDVLFIACCGFDVQRTLKDMSILINKNGWNDLPAVKQEKVYITDGNAYFSRPGPRLVDGLEIMANALYPETHSLPIGLTPAINYLKH